MKSIETSPGVTAVMKTTPTLPADDPTVSPEAQPRQVIGRFVQGATSSPDANGAVSELGPAERNGAATVTAPALPKDPLVLFSHEGPDSYIGGHVARIIPALAKGGR